jgi:hypothetical protein
MGVDIKGTQEFGAFSGRVTLTEGPITHLSFEHHNTAATVDTLRILLDRAYAQGYQDAKHLGEEA